MGISPRQLAALEDRLRGKKPGGRSAADAGAGTKSILPKVLLGIDPSLRAFGKSRMGTDRAFQDSSRVLIEKDRLK